MDELRVYEDIFNIGFRHLPKNREYAGVIVEPREHEHLSLVLRNFAYMLPDWSLYIFHSRENEGFIRGILGNNHNVNLVRYSDGNISTKQYNNLLVSKYFYDNIRCNKMLVFQTDSFIRRKGIEEFLRYDYIGAPWTEDTVPIHIGKDKIDTNLGSLLTSNIRIGNGGFSLRDKSVMLDVIDRLYYTDINEDVYFSMGTTLLGGKLPSVEIASSFSVECIYHPDPIGWHKAYYFYNGHLWRSLKSINITSR